MAEAEALQCKKSVCAGHRASATRIQGQITTALGATPPNVERLSMLKLTLEVKQKTLKELDDEIVALVPNKELDTEIQQADEYQENIFEALVLINHTLTPVTTPEAPITTAPTIEPRVTSPTAPSLKINSLKINSHEINSCHQSYAVNYFLIEITLYILIEANYKLSSIKCFLIEERNERSGR